MMGQPCSVCGAPSVYFVPFPYCAGCYVPPPVTVPTVAGMLAPLAAESPGVGWLDFAALVARVAELERITENQTGEL